MDQEKAMQIEEGEAEAGEEGLVVGEDHRMLLSMPRIGLI